MASGPGQGVASDWGHWLQVRVVLSDNFQIILTTGPEFIFSLCYPTHQSPALSSTTPNSNTRLCLHLQYFFSMISIYFYFLLSFKVSCVALKHTSTDVFLLLVQ